MRLLRWLRNHWFILLLIVFAFTFRIVYLFPDTIPFSFDHGKDSIAVLHMVKTFSPKFIGPWTSIPGLYFGPGWYYLLAPLFVITNGNPVSAALMMTLMIMLEILLSYKYFGKQEAIIFATAPGWIIISKSAWNPFPMTLLMLLFMIVLKKMKLEKDHVTRNVFLLFLIVSLGFHFSAAFAILWVISLIVILAIRKTKISIPLILVAMMGFSIPFMPQALFELKHDFVETKAVISYFTKGEPQKGNLGKIVGVFSTTMGEAKIFVLPEIRQVSIVSVTNIGFFLLCIGLLFTFIKRKQYVLWKESVTLFVVPLLGFFFLHFNYWYITALMPVFALLVAHIMRNAPKPISYLYFFLLFLTPIFAYDEYLRVDKPQILQSREMLPAKDKAIEFVYKESQGKPFSSYHYVPDIYDYSYQYLYIWNAFNGKTLPVEFSYKPFETSYIPEKDELLSKLPKTVGSAEKIFFIVEKAQNNDFLNAWWGQQKYGTMVKNTVISPEITVYEATPIGR